MNTPLMPEENLTKQLGVLEIKSPVNLIVLIGQKVISQSDILALKDKLEPYYNLFLLKIMGEKNPWIIIYRQIDCAIIDKKKLIDIINNL